MKGFAAMFLLLAEFAADSPYRLLWPGPLIAFVYGLVGIALLLLGYKLFDWLTPHIHVQKELMQNNTAVAVVVASLLLGIAFVAAHVVQ
jgi:putative membrane protein